jgi:hypothetical protein
MTNFPLSQPHAFMHDSRDHSSASRQLPHRRAWLVLALLGGRHRKREEAVAACAADEKAEWDRIAAEEEADRVAVEKGVDDGGSAMVCGGGGGASMARTAHGPSSRCHGYMYHQVVGVLQCLVEARSGRGSPAVDGKDGSRPVHLAATGTIRRSACCSSMTRTAHGPSISLPWVPSGGRCAAAR